MKDFLSINRFFNARRLLLPAIAACGLLMVITTIGCSANKGDYNSLENQGILPLSPSNAYLGTNLFLGEEAENSRVLFEFLKGRGAPGAIEINKQSFKAKSMTLFYPKQSHYYVADLLVDTKSYEWIVRGPFSIDREDFRKMSEIQKNHYEASPFIIGGELTSFYKAPPTPTARPTLPPVTPKPVKKTVRPKPVATTQPIIVQGQVTPAAISPTLSTIPSGAGLNSDQQAIRLSKGLVELSPSGDLIHRVGNDTETLDAIATWYTGDSAKAKAIAEFNGLASGTPMAKGAKILIPKDLSKTDKIMGKN